MKRPVESIPPSMRTTRDRIDARNIRKARAELDQAAAERRRKQAELASIGILPHNDPDDPWAETELRPCEPGCPAHGGSAA